MYNQYNTAQQAEVEVLIPWIWLLGQTKALDQQICVQHEARVWGQISWWVLLVAFLGFLFVWGFVLVFLGGVGFLFVCGFCYFGRGGAAVVVVVVIFCLFNANTTFSSPLCPPRQETASRCPQGQTRLDHTSSAVPGSCEHSWGA